MDKILNLIATIVTPVGLIVVATINYWSSVKALNSAKEAREAIEKASQTAQWASQKATEDAQKARTQVQSVETRQIETAKATSVDLADIKQTTHIVHTIVNSQHSKLLQLIANLTSRVAYENPSDMQAQDDAKQAADAIGINLKGTEIKDTDLSKP